MAEYDPTDDDVKILQDMKTKLDGLNGSNVSNTPSGATIVQQPVKPKRRPNIIGAADTTAPQYQGMVYMGLSGNVAGWGALAAIDSLPTT